jgi:TPP-dependent pyruvate/acetoin dehydrogenase alpha subunit
MMAELFGRATGICGGKGGSMHIADPRLGILGANGIVGAGIPISVGAGLTSKVLGDDRVAVAFFGDGAVHTGAFHEAATLAVAWALPVVFVCENNGYAEFTPTARWRGPSPVERAAAYGFATSAVDGSDAYEVQRLLREVVERTRTRAEPSFVEAQTTRFSGHYEGDPQPYRPESELATISERDPLLVLRRRLQDEVAANEIDVEAAAEMEQAVQTALAAPYPRLDAVLEDIYV